MKKITSIIIIGILLGCSFSVQGFLFEKPTEKTTITDLKDILFDKKIEVCMRLAKFPSLSACIIDGDKVVWSKGYGVSNIEHQYTATENTVYGICSITKTITGTALMQLFDQGLFNLDDDVNNYLPFNLRNPNFPDDPITFRMLLSHSSSLRDRESYWLITFYHEGGPPFEGYPMPWLEDYLVPGRSTYDSYVWDSINGPGTFSEYANINFDLIGYLVELISGEPFCTYCEDHIFKPLEMYNTSFNLSSYTEEDLAVPYNWNPQNNIYEKNYNMVFLHYMAGGLFSTVIDMSHFMMMQMNGGSYKNTRILKESTVEEMHKIQSPNFNPARAYGLAWYFEPHLFQIGKGNFCSFLKIYEGHGGALTTGLRTSMWMKTSGDSAVLFFVNSDSFLYPKGANGIDFLRNALFLKANSL
ncbi:D-aminopeptidase [uncultured archaeon]|nr:D-aminopeptidase [uncultured archaeon]